MQPTVLDKWESQVRTVAYVPQPREYVELMMLGSKSMLEKMRLAYMVIGGLCLVAAIPIYFVYDFLSWIAVGFGVYIFVLGWASEKFSKLTVKPFLKGKLNRNIYVRRYHEVSESGLRTFCDDGSKFDIPWSAVVDLKISEDGACFLYSRYHGVSIPRRAVPSDDDWNRLRALSSKALVK